MPPTYDFGCDKHRWEVVCKIAERENEHRCPACGAVGTQLPAAPNIDKGAAGSWNQQSYNPALGCWTKSWKHGREIAKARGLEEVGDEPVDKLHDKFEKQRAETRKARWADDRELVYAKTPE